MASAVQDYWINGEVKNLLANKLDTYIYIFAKIRFYSFYFYSIDVNRSFGIRKDVWKVVYIF